jgi:hypothetical protein
MANYNDKTMLEIFGTDQLYQLFQSLQEDIQDEIINKSFRKAAKLLISESKKNLSGVVKTIPGHRFSLPGSLGSTLFKFEKRIIIGTKKKYGGHLAHIFDSGTNVRHYITKSGKSHNTGEIKASGFFSNAVTGTEQQIKDLIASDMQKRLSQTVKRMNKLAKTAAK